MNVVDFFDDEPDIDEVDELREILTHYHMKTLLQVRDFQIELKLNYFSFRAVLKGIFILPKSLESIDLSDRARGT